jgi:glycerol kinase
MTLVIDQGTHASRALLFDAQGRVRQGAYARVALKRLAADVVEQDAGEILASVHTVIEQVLKSPGGRNADLASAGLATQRSSVLAWDVRNGLPLSPVLSWQDRRNADLIRDLNAYRHTIKQISGLQLSPHYGASKIRWLLDHSTPVRNALKKKCLAVGPLAAYLVSQLVQGRVYVVDHANALRTQLLNLDRLEWDPRLLELFGVPRHLLPECRPVRHEYGRLRAADVPLTAVNGDQTAAVYCLGAPPRRQAVVNIGTGAFVLLPTGTQRVVENALLSGLAGNRNGDREYVLEGTVNGAGAALNWAAQRWALDDPIARLGEWMNSGGEVPIFINTVGGLGSPWWQAGPAPPLIGGGSAPQKAVAVVESILFMLTVNIERMRATGQVLASLRIGGGLARVDEVCRRLASLSGLAVYRPLELETTARGIAWQAGGGPARWPKPGRGKWFKPTSDRRLAARYRRFRQVMDGLSQDA